MPPKVPYYSGFTPASPTASRIKQANRREGGRAERLLGRALWRAGLRYRKHAASLPGRPDFVFAGARVCLFCDGDFWHGRDWDALRERLARRANPEYWLISAGKLYIFGKPAPMGPALFEQDLAANIAKADQNRALLQGH